MISAALGTNGSSISPSKLDKFMQALLEGCPSTYAIVANDKIIGRFERRERTEQDERGRTGLLGKLRKVASRIFVRDWCVELKNGSAVITDHRPLLAAMILLMEQTIANDQAT